MQGAEAIHGDVGIVALQGIVIAISSSVKRMAPASSP
jgi:D-arabinose 5-phosphate isomerase GutQ